MQIVRRFSATVAAAPTVSATAVGPWAFIAGSGNAHAGGASSSLVCAMASSGTWPESEDYKGNHRQPAAKAEDPLARCHAGIVAREPLIRYCPPSRGVGFRSVTSPPSGPGSARRCRARRAGSTQTWRKCRRRYARGRGIGHHTAIIRPRAVEGLFCEVHELTMPAEQVQPIS
jgi:hypothetical protein